MLSSTILFSRSIWKHYWGIPLRSGSGSLIIWQISPGIGNLWYGNSPLGNPLLYTDNLEAPWNGEGNPLHACVKGITMFGNLFLKKTVKFTVIFTLNMLTFMTVCTIYSFCFKKKQEKRKENWKLSCGNIASHSWLCFAPIVSLFETWSICYLKSTCY